MHSTVSALESQIKHQVEPRAIKQRHKPFKTLDKPRHIEKIRLKKKIDKMIAKYAEA